MINDVSVVIPTLILTWLPPTRTQSSSRSCPPISFCAFRLILGGVPVSVSQWLLELFVDEYFSSSISKEWDSNAVLFAALPTMTYYVLFIFVVKWTLEKAANIDGFSPRTSSIPSLVSCSTTVRRPWRISLVGLKHVFKLLNNWSMHQSKFCHWTIILIFRRGSLQGV